MRRMLVIGVLALMFAFGHTAAWAQDYPAKPVRVVIPWPPGGSNDIVGRIISQKLSEATGQQFVVDNRGGAAGTIGSDVVAKSAPDGYTIMVHSATHVANPHLYGKLPYDTLKDFAAVAPVSAQIGMLIVHPSLPVQSVKEFIALAKRNPDEIRYSSSGNGSFVHLTMAMLNVMTGTKMIHVPYKGGGPAAISIASGETQAQVGHDRRGHAAGEGESRAAARRDFRLPRRRVSRKCPRSPRRGSPGYEFTAWIGTLAPAGTPKAIVDKLNGDIQKVLKLPDVAANLKSQTLDPLIMSPEQFAQRLKSDYDKYEKVIKITGAKID